LSKFGLLLYCCCAAQLVDERGNFRQDNFAKMREEVCECVYGLPAGCMLPDFACMRSSSSKCRVLLCAAQKVLALLGAAELALYILAELCQLTHISKHSCHVLAIADV
jgi:hypothetical protein